MQVFKFPYIIDIFQDQYGSVDLVSTGPTSLVFAKASLSILIKHALGR